MENVLIVLFVLLGLGLKVLGNKKKNNSTNTKDTASTALNVEDEMLNYGIRDVLLQQKTSANDENRSISPDLRGNSATDFNEVLDTPFSTLDSVPTRESILASVEDAYGDNDEEVEFESELETGRIEDFSFSLREAVIANVILERPEY